MMTNALSDAISKELQAINTIIYMKKNAFCIIKILLKKTTIQDKILAVDVYGTKH